MSKVGEISSLVVKVVERCNLNCSYCYMYNHADQSYLQRPAFMSEEIFEQLLNRINEYCDQSPGRRMSITLHGGEPMLMGPARFEKLAGLAQHKLGDRLRSLHMQSNATLVDDRWISALRAFRIPVSVSLDGPAEIHNMFRVDHSGNGSHARVLKGLHRLLDEGLLTGVLCVINPAYSGVGIYRYFRSLGISKMNFLLPDASHDSKQLLYGKYGETPVADYLIPIFDDWFSEDEPDVSVRLFEDMIRSILGGPVSTDAIGNVLSNYVVIDTDGAIGANDALKVCAEGMPETGLNILEHGLHELDRGLPLVHRLLNEGIPLCSTCQQCPEKSTCGGGHVPHRYSRVNGFDNPSIWCKDLLKMFEYVRERISFASCA